MINVLVSVNDDYLEKVKTMLFSMSKYATEEISVYLMNHDLDKGKIERCKEYLWEKCKITLKTIDVANTVFDALPTVFERFSIEMYYRIIAQFVLPENIDRILWLDADVILLKDISSFYHQDFEGAKYVVCEDANSDAEWMLSVKKNLDMKATDRYFNSGIMLMNIKELRAETDLDSIVDTCYKLMPKLTYPDQDILNYLYSADVKYSERNIYNFQLGDAERIDKQTLNDIVVLHYCGAKKPWNYWQLNNASKHYWKVRIQQGYWKEAVRTYWRKIKEMTLIYLREVKDILF